MLRTVAIGAGMALTLAVGIAVAGTPLGDGDDTGFVPPTKSVLKCEASLAKNIAKAALGLTICHIKSATLQFSQKPFDEEMCEASTLGKFSAKNGKLTGCPPCVQEILSSIQIPVEIVADNATGGTFCASPSGAFLN